MKLGVITDGISRDLEHALTVMNETGLDYAELQFIGAKEVGDLNDREVGSVHDLIKAHQVKVSCISRHIFGGLSLAALNSDDHVYLSHIESLKRCIEMAKAVDSPLVRVMSFRKEMIFQSLCKSRTAPMTPFSKNSLSISPSVRPAITLSMPAFANIVVPIMITTTNSH